MQNVLVIADDLSGATDVGAQFGKAGVRNMVVLAHAMDQFDFSRAFEANSVVLVDTQSRHLSPAEAGKRIVQVLEKTAAAKVDVVYKKTDSTLRGNIGAELEALLEFFGDGRVCFIPAHPALGRTTENGIHYVDGIPLAESSFANDPRSPTRESGVANILRSQANSPIRIIRKGETPKWNAKGILVFDAVAVSDIDAIGRQIHQAGMFKALAGSAGFAATLPEILNLPRTTPAPRHLLGPLLIVNGSLNEVALEQCRSAGPNFARLRVEPTALCGEGLKSRASQAARRLAAGENVVLSTVWERSEEPAYVQALAAQGLESGAISDYVAGQIGVLAAAILAGMNKAPLTLMVIGGDTLAGVARANCWSGFIPLNELLPGVACCEIPGEENLTLLTKPGGFGDADFIGRIRVQR